MLQLQHTGTTRGESPLQAMHRMALLFAREAGVEPDLTGVATVGSSAIVWSAFSHFIPLERP